MNVKRLVVAITATACMATPLLAAKCDPPPPEVGWCAPGQHHGGTCRKHNKVPTKKPSTGGKKSTKVVCRWRNWDHDKHYWNCGKKDGTIVIIHQSHSNPPRTG